MPLCVMATVYHMTASLAYTSHTHAAVHPNSVSGVNVPVISVSLVTYRPIIRESPVYLPHM